MFAEKNLTRYSSIGISIMLLSSVLLTSQTFDFGKEALAEDTSIQNIDQVDGQSPGPGHFRGGHINWRPTGSGNQVEFNVINAFTRSEYTSCINPITLVPIACTGTGGHPGVGDVFRETVANGHIASGMGGAGTELFFGDGSNSGALFYRVDAINVVQDSLLAHAIDPLQPGEKIRHVYGSTGPFTAEINDFARDVVEENNFARGYRISTIVNLSISNNSPVATFTPLVVCPEALCTFAIAATDPNGDSLNFRLSSSSEASDPIFGAFVQPGQGTAQPLTVSSTGIVSWDATGFAHLPFCNTFADPFCLYSASITIEEIRSGSVIGKVTVDFLINIAAPKFDVPPTPANGSTFNMIVGVTLPFLVQCSDPNDGDTVTIGNLGLPIDATFAPAVPTGNPASGIFTFTPTFVQTVTVTFTCTDGEGNSAPPHSIRIVVKPAPPLVVKTIHAEKESFDVVEDGIPMIKDITIIAEIYEDLNTQLVMKKQALVITCLKIPNTGEVLECNSTIPPMDVTPVENCLEDADERPQTLNTIVKKGSSTDNTEGMNTVLKGALVKTISAHKEIFICDFANSDPTDDVRVDLVLFTEIFENLNLLNANPPQSPVIKTSFEAFRCVMDLDTFEVQSCEFPMIF